MNGEREYLTEDKYNLVLDNLDLVDFVIIKHLRISRGSVEYEDYKQEGMVGLVLAAIRFDVSKGTKFSTFAVPYISGHIKNYRREFVNGYGLYIPKSVMELIPRVMSLYYEGFTYTEIRDKLGITSLEMQEIASLGKIVSFEDGIRDSDGEMLTIADIVGNPDDNIADLLGEDFIDTAIEFVASKFRADNRKNIWYEYSYLSVYGERPAYDTIAKKYNTTKQNVSLVIKAGSERLKKYVERSGGI